MAQKGKGNCGNDGVGFVEKKKTMGQAVKETEEI
jgi:hypothetical protein